MISRGFEVLIAAGLVMGITVSPALAYLDPGTGSILLQLLLGGVAGFLVIVKLYWHSFKQTVARITGRTQPKQ
jgi:hypothetical protein